MKELFDKKWIQATETVFTEELNQQTKKRELYLVSKIIPKNQISRNKVLYNNESISNYFIKNLVGKPLLHQHKNNDDVLPKGVWKEGWEDDKFAYGRALVYDKPYNKDYIEWLEAAKEANSPINTSLQVSGIAENKEAMDGKEAYTECYINDVVEVSTVLTPGFLGAEAMLENFAESLQRKEPDMFKELLKAKYKPKSMFDELINIK